MRKNPRAEVLPFEQDVVPVVLDPHASVLANAARLAAVGGGGTNCSAPLALLNRREARRHEQQNVAAMPGQDIALIPSP